MDRRRSACKQSNWKQQTRRRENQNKSQLILWESRNLLGLLKWKQTKAYANNKQMCHEEHDRAAEAFWAWAKEYTTA